MLNKNEHKDLKMDLETEKKLMELELKKHTQDQMIQMMMQQMMMQQMMSNQFNSMINNQLNNQNNLF
jgi:uncharacterized coiled-coil protein SlyX